MNKRLIEPLGLFEDRHRIRVVEIEFDGRCTRRIEPLEPEDVRVKSPRPDRKVFVVGLSREIEVLVAEGKARTDVRGSLVMFLIKNNIVTGVPSCRFDPGRERGRSNCGHSNCLETGTLGPARLKLGDRRRSAGPLILQRFENLIHSGSPCIRRRKNEHARRSNRAGAT